MNLNFLLVQSTGIIRKSFPFVPRSLLVLLFFAGLGNLTKVQADGMFVAPKFVWDKHKDINEPTQKAIIVYDAGREDLILQVKYEGPVEEFGWLIPVPGLPTVEKGSMKCFYELSKYTQEHFEPHWRHSQTKGATLGMDESGKPEPVKVIEVKTVGAYEIAVLSTRDPGALAKWLTANQFYFPTNKTDVLDSYVKQQWYFIAVKINLGKNDGFQLVTGSPKGNAAPKSGYSTELKLANGELHPLQISFASDRCVFPLKISSVNGKPSEVQVYVLSSEPLLERTMLEKKLPLIYSNDVVQAAKQAQLSKNMLLLEMTRDIGLRGEMGKMTPVLSAEDTRKIQRISETLVATPDNSLPYAKVTKTDLPDCNQAVSRLADKSWWLTKQTWTFKPKEMRDLVFGRAISTLAEELGTKFGYYTAVKLSRFGVDAIPVFVAAFQDTNRIVRINAASVFNRGDYAISDPELTKAAVASLKDPEAEVRMAGVHIMAHYGNWSSEFSKPLIALLRDEDPDVRRVVASCLIRFRSDIEPFVPVFQEMLKDKNPNIQASGLAMLVGLRVPIHVEDLLPLFKIHHDLSHPFIFNSIGQALYYERVSNEEVIPLLQCSNQPAARMMGLRVLYENADKQSVELALQLLKDSNEFVRQRSAATLRALTGQHFTDKQTAEWDKWWTENKTNFVVQLHPEELRPQRRGESDFRRYLTNRPPAGIP